MIHLTPRKKDQCATKDTEYLHSKVFEFCNLFRLHIFCDSVQLKHVGMDVYDSQKILAGISFTLSKLKVIPTTCSVILPHLFPTLTQCHIMVILFSYIFFPRYALRVVGSRATRGLRFPISLHLPPLCCRKSPFRH